DRREYLPHCCPNIGRRSNGRSRLVPRRPILFTTREQAPGRAAESDQRQAGANIFEPLSKMDFRPALDHLLLSIFRFGQEPVRKPVRLSIQSRQFPTCTPYLRHASAMGWKPEPLGLRARVERSFHGSAIQDYDSFDV